MKAEYKAFYDIYQQQHNAQLKLIQTNHNMALCNLYRIQLAQMATELNALFTTGLGRRTAAYQTILNTEDSFCQNGLCKLHLIQIFLDNAYTAYLTKAIPQKFTEKTALYTEEYQWIIPT